MDDKLWKSVDDYLAEKLLPEDPALKGAIERNTAEGLPAIDVSALQGRFLYLLARLHGARRILEIGTLGGYSTICLARALPADGKLISLELEEKHARVARENIEVAGLTERVEIRVGPALESLTRLQAEKAGPFDFVFIDADKPNTGPYFERAMEMCRSGSVIIADNVVRKGMLVDAASKDANVQGMRRFIDTVAKDRRVEATTLQTVGAKGYDGFTLIRVL
ncbi:MAG TPA: O-methyltransferase [Candidatus Polarisedimenticolia bacterium]|nr:O-methyltransferase [Candidatus Polarisedimenticolia bacterium]